MIFFKGLDITLVYSVIKQQFSQNYYEAKPKYYLDDAKIEALSPPKHEKATAMGIVQLKMPKTWSANV